MLSLLAFIIIAMYVITMAVLVLWTCVFVLTNLIVFFFILNTRIFL